MEDYIDDLKGFGSEVEQEDNTYERKTGTTEVFLKGTRQTVGRNTQGDETKELGSVCLICGAPMKFDFTVANARYISHIGGNSTFSFVVFPLEDEPTCFIESSAACYFGLFREGPGLDERPAPEKRARVMGRHSGFAT